MAAKNVGTLIKEARSAAKLTQAQLASQVDDVSASDIGKAERGEKELTQTQLKQIARATGITQKSLLEAPKGGTGAAKTTSAAKKTGSSSSTLKLTAAEKKLVELYRAADSDTRKAAVSLLKGEKTDLASLVSSLLSGSGKAGDDGILGNLLSTVMQNLGK